MQIASTTNGKIIVFPRDFAGSMGDELKALKFPNAFGASSGISTIKASPSGNSSQSKSNKHAKTNRLVTSEYKINFPNSVVREASVRIKLLKDPKKTSDTWVRLKQVSEEIHSLRLVIDDTIIYQVSGYGLYLSTICGVMKYKFSGGGEYYIDLPGFPTISSHAHDLKLFIDFHQVETSMISSVEMDFFYSKQEQQICNITSQCQETRLALVMEKPGLYTARLPFKHLVNIVNFSITGAFCADDKNAESAMPSNGANADGIDFKMKEIKSLTISFRKMNNPAFVVECYVDRQSAKHTFLNKHKQDIVNTCPNFSAFDDVFCIVEMNKPTERTDLILHGLATSYNTSIISNGRFQLLH